MNPEDSSLRGPETLGMLLGFLGVAIFAATLPLTRLALPSSARSMVRPDDRRLGEPRHLGVMSVYLGLFAWNAGLAIGGVALVSQVQLLQTFLTIAIAAALLGERIDAETVLCAILIVALVFVGRRFRVKA